MPGGSVLIRDLEISNERGHTVRVTVWAEFNSLLNEEEIFEKSKTKPLVIAYSSLQLAIDFNGFKLKTYSGTRIFMDEAIPEIGEAKKKYNATPLIVSPSKEIRRMNSNLQDMSRITVKELLEKYTSTDTVKELACCVGTILDFDEAQGWCYRGCPEHSTKLKLITDKKKSEEKCTTCNKVVVDPKLCYRFSALIVDETVNESEAVVFVIFNTPGEKMMECPASDLHFLHNIPESELPPQMMSLIGRQFLFTGKYNPGYGRRPRANFAVLNVEPHVPSPGDVLAISDPSTTTSEKHLTVPTTNREETGSTLPITPAKTRETLKRTSSSNSRDRTTLTYGSPSKKTHVRTVASNKRATED